MSGKQQPQVRPPAAGKNSRLWILAVVAVAVVVVVAFANRQRTVQGPADGDSLIPTPVSAAVLHDLSAIPAATWDAVGAADATIPIFVGAPEAQGGKPTFLYIGALYCPYCAAARWSVITALARFGTFDKLFYSASSSQDVFPSTPTFSFYGGNYASEFVDFQSVELQGAEPVGGRYPPLQSPTPEQEALIRKYDAPPFVSQAGTGGIPFMLIGEKYMWSGSPFNPGLLAGRSHDAIAGSLAAGGDATAHAILANANQISAAICAVDGGKPKDVCGSPAVMAAMKALPTTSPK